MKTVILFDLDGTLLYTLPSITAALNRTLERYGLSAISLERVRELVGNSSRYLVDHTLDETGGAAWTAEKRTEFLDAYNGDYLSHPIEDTHPYEGIADLLQALKAAGKTLWVYSNKPDAIAKEVVKHFFGDTLDVVRGFREDTPRKPDPTGVFCMMEEAGVKKEDMYYVGDSEVDWKLGKAAGLETIMVSYGFRTREELLRTTDADPVASVEALHQMLL